MRTPLARLFLLAVVSGCSLVAKLPGVSPGPPTCSFAPPAVDSTIALGGIAAVIWTTGLEHCVPHCELVAEAIVASIAAGVAISGIASAAVGFVSSGRCLRSRREAAEREAAIVLARQDAKEVRVLIDQAAAAIARSDCATLLQLASRIEARDPTHYQRVLLADPVVSGCFESEQSVLADCEEANARTYAAAMAEGDLTARLALITGISDCRSVRSIASTLDRQPSAPTPMLPPALVISGSTSLSVDGGRSARFQETGGGNLTGGIDVALDVPRFFSAFHVSFDHGSYRPHMTLATSRFFRFRLGPQLRGCGEALCAILGVDVGHQRQGDLTSGTIVGGRFGVEVGMGDRRSWRLQLTVDAYLYSLTTTIGTEPINELRPGTGVTLTLGYRAALTDSAPRTAPVIEPPRAPQPPWQLVRETAIAATRSECDLVVRVLVDTEHRDPARYSLLAKDPMVVACVAQQRQTRHRAREQCLARRVELSRRAQASSDPRVRTEILVGLPSCDPPEPAP
jgi:hypothetical protein